MEHGKPRVLYDGEPTGIYQWKPLTEFMRGLEGSREVISNHDRSTGIGAGAYFMRPEGVVMGVISFSDSHITVTAEAVNGTLPAGCDRFFEEARKAGYEVPGT